MVFFKVFWLLMLGLTTVRCQEGGSYYSTFSGPVSGAVDEIVVPETSGFQANLDEPSFDYVARPDYTFGYGVNDPVTGNAQKHEETRDGDNVRGQYSVLEPDGTLRTVVYTADPQNGFQATVHRKPPAGSYFPPPQHFGFADNSLQDFGGEDIGQDAGQDFQQQDLGQEYSPQEYNADDAADYTPSDYQQDYQQQQEY